jgi:hypothetical protein
VWKWGKKFAYRYPSPTRRARRIVGGNRRTIKLKSTPSRTTDCSPSTSFRRRIARTVPQQMASFRVIIVGGGICHGLDKLWKWNVVCFGVNMYE